MRGSFQKVAGSTVSIIVVLVGLLLGGTWKALDVIGRVMTAFDASDRYNHLIDWLATNPRLAFDYGPWILVAGGVASLTAIHWRFIRGLFPKRSPGSAQRPLPPPAAPQYTPADSSSDSIAPSMAEDAGTHFTATRSHFHGYPTLARRGAKVEFTDSTADSIFRNRTSDLHYPAPSGEFSGLTDVALAEALIRCAERSVQLSGGEIEDYQKLPEDFHKIALTLASEALRRIGDMLLHDGDNDYRGIMGSNELLANSNKSLVAGGLIPFFLQFLAARLMNRRS